MIFVPLTLDHTEIRASHLVMGTNCRAIEKDLDKGLVPIRGLFKETLPYIQLSHLDGARKSPV